MDGLLQLKCLFKTFSVRLLVIFLFLNSSALGAYGPFIEIGGAKHWSKLSSASTSYDLFIPLLQSDNSIVFTDLRIFNHTGKSFEGNAHVGYRYLVDDKDIVSGVYSSFDRRQTDYGNWFSQITAGAELWINRLFIGVNIYQPIGKSSRETYSTQSIGNRIFDIPNVAMTTQITIHQHRERALYGTDADLGYEITNNLTGYFGGYYFSSSNANTIAGPKISFVYSYQRSHGKVFGVLDAVNIEAGAQHDKPRGMLAYMSIRAKIGLDRLDDIRGRSINKHMVSLVRRDRDIVCSAETHPSTIVSTKVELPTSHDVIEAFKIDTNASSSSVADQLALFYYYLSDKKLYASETDATKAISFYTGIIYDIASKNSEIYSSIKSFINSYQGISKALVWMDIKMPIESFAILGCNTDIQALLLKSSIIDISGIPKNIEDLKKFRKKILAMYSPNRYNHTIKDTKLFVEWESLLSGLMDKLTNSKSPCVNLFAIGNSVPSSSSLLQVRPQNPHQYWVDVHSVLGEHKNHTYDLSSTDRKSSELMSVTYMPSPNSTPVSLANSAWVDVVYRNKYFIDTALKDNRYPASYAAVVGFISTGTSYYFVSEFFKSLASPTASIIGESFPILTIAMPVVKPVLAFGYSVVGRTAGKLSEMLIENKEITKEVLIETSITNAITDSNLAGRIDSKGVFSSVWLKVDVKFYSTLAKGCYKGFTESLVLSAYVGAVDTLLYFGGTYTITQMLRIVSNNKLSITNPTYSVHMFLRLFLKVAEFARSFV
jgi:hypothetical protein